MAITLGTNITAYSSRVLLNKTGDELNNIYKKLSTGKKINSAGDDAAGLVISQNMQAKIDGSKQAMQNIQTAQSFLTIAEDGMVSISEHFQRINDLLTNMANDTNDINARTAAVREVIERLSEIDRLAESTNFNGMNMLDGSTKSIIVQMAPDTEKSISTLDISKALTDCHISTLKTELPGVLNPDAKINKYTVGDEEYKDIIIPKTYEDDQYRILKRTVTTTEGEGEEEHEVQTVTYNILKRDSNGNYVYTDPDNKDVIYEKPAADSGITDEFTSVTEGYMIESSDGTISYAVSDGKTNPSYYLIGKQYAQTDSTYSVGENLLSAYDPSNENCRAYMKTIQDTISKIATQRGLLGAYENRMISSYDSLTTRIESLESAKSPYTDTDIAQEATSLAQKQILQQINVSIMQSANSNQQMALSLLG